jgi:hypothetical protein
MLKSLTALALAAQASALGVGVYSDPQCSMNGNEGIATLSMGTCSPLGATGKYVGVSACSSGTTATVAILSDCSGAALNTGDITTSCTLLTTVGSNARYYAKIETSIDSTCGDAAKSFIALGHVDATCTTVTSGNIIIADDVCRGRTKVRMRGAGCRIPLTSSLLHTHLLKPNPLTHTRAPLSPPTPPRAQSTITGGLITTTAFSDSACTTSAYTLAGIPSTGTCKVFNPAVNTGSGNIGSAKALALPAYPPGSGSRTSGASETATAAAVVVGAAAAIVMAARA